jgi:uncharacterized glyoxalase superfamily protein PhnB
MNFSAATPIFRIFDEAKAREFYVDFLGFTIEFEHRFEPTAPLYMGISLGACKLHLSEHHGDASPGSSIRIQCDDVDALQQTLLAKHYKYARPGVQDQEWGMREMTIGDGFGNKLIFYKPLR